VAASFADKAHSMMNGKVEEQTEAQGAKEVCSQAQKAKEATPPADDFRKLGDFRPKKVNSLSLSQLNWEDLESDREWRTSLLLRGLPRKLCKIGEMEALLKMHHLWDSVQDVRELPIKGTKLGCVILNAKTVSDVPKIAKFFHGCQLGGSTPVGVSFAPMQAKHKAPGSMSRLQGLALPMKQVKQVCGDSGDSTASGSPRASSGGSDAAEDGAPRATQSRRAKSLPRPISPPPGISQHKGTKALVQ